MNHTPGPWFYQFENGKDSVFAHDVEGGDPWTICHCVDPLVTFGERKATAQLIAAAPELLEALKIALTTLLPVETEPRFCEINKTWHDDPVETLTKEEVIELLRAAIAKAEGKDQS